jgi:prepilin-type N-terminal cleavage/methylation domain-containing protein
MRTHRDRLPRRNGFTLVELACVLVVITILAGIGMPTVLGRIQRAQVTAAARQISEDVQMTQSRAITQGIQTRLVAFDHAGNAPDPSGAPLSEPSKA